MTDEHKSLQALLNGVIRHDYLNDSEMTDEFLKSELYQDMEEDSFKQLVHKMRGLIKSMAGSNMDLNQAEAFLTLQTKKKDSKLTEDHAKVFLKVWKAQRNKIHESLIQRCVWGNTLKNLSWRIDVKSRARHVSQINTPSAIVELQLENKQDSSKEPEAVNFEMDEQKMSEMLQNLKDIEEQINKYCQQ